MDVLISQYADAKDLVINEGFDTELDWQQNLNFANSREKDFLREAAWVILSSGMRETVIRMKFPEIEAAFLGFSNACDIVNNANKCRADAMKSFGHAGKIDAIISMASRVASDGFETVKYSVDYQGVKYLQSFDYIGPTTSYHLAKNLGLNVAKPDRHLCRIAKVSGFNSVTELCETLSEVTGDSVSVIDLVIWRFATIRNDYLHWFKVD